MKISDNVAVDENEPEVLFDGLTHSDEHMGLEMTLQIMHWLADGYGHDTRITNIVNSARGLDHPRGQSRTAPSTTSPAGGSTSGARTASRTPGTTAIGTDLNRNFGYRWGGGGRTSTNPAAITYRGSDRLLGARDPERSATSWPAASSTAASRSGRRSRSTRPAGS